MAGYFKAKTSGSKAPKNPAVPKPAPISAPKPKASGAHQTQKSKLTSSNPFRKKPMPGFEDSAFAYSKMMNSANTLIKNRKK